MSAPSRFALVALVVCSGVAGCATQPISTGPQSYVATAPCAETMSTLSARPIPLQSKDGKPPPAIAVDAKVACLRDERNNARPILLFSLAGIGIPAEVQITTLGKGGVTLAPFVRILGADFTERARYPFEGFAKRGADFSLSIFLNDPAASPMYLAITADGAWLGKDNLTVAGRSQTTVWSTGVVTGSLTTGWEEKMHSTFSDIGELTVLAKPYATVSTDKL